VSLDVYLYGPERTEECRCDTCDHEHTRTVRQTLYSANITHNLNRMAEEAGIYKVLWRPDEIGATRAVDIIASLRAGLTLLESDPRRFEAFNAPNGWGLYEHFVPFVEKYLAACCEHPLATIRVSR
jgi:hypothetical protein